MEMGLNKICFKVKCCPQKLYTRLKIKIILQLKFSQVFN